MSVPGQHTLESLRVEHGEPLADADLPRVGVVIVNCDGRRMLVDCLGRLFASDYPEDRLSVVVVDNASRDGSVDWLARNHPRVHVVANSRNTGFTPACNQGVKRLEEVEGPQDVPVFLNNDVRVEPTWLRELVGPIVRGECASTGARMLSRDGTRIDHAGGGTNFHGIAVATGYQHPPGPGHDFPRRCLFACGGAMAISREAFDALGGFDEDFFAYYDDLDIGWRTNLAGFEVHYAPRAVCRHDHSGTSSRFPTEQLRVLQVRNALLTCIKNYDEENLNALLPALLALSMRRMWVMARIQDDSEFRLERADVRSRSWKRALASFFGLGRRHFRLDRIAAGDFVGINDVLGRWKHWMEVRASVQATRRVTDGELFQLFEKPLWCVEGEPAYEELQADLIKRSGLLEQFEKFTVGGPDPSK